MILDKDNTCSNAQSITTGNIVSTDAIDLWRQAAVPTIPGGAVIGSGSASVIKDVGRGKKPTVLCQVVTAFASMTSVQAQLIGATAADLTTGQVIYQETVAIPVATLVAGYKFRLSMPVGITLRYLGFRFVVVGTGTGAVTAGLLYEEQDYPAV